MNQVEQIKKFASYLVVGGGATVVEWACYRLFSSGLGIQYLAATALAIVISTFSNWLFGRLLTFRHAERQPFWRELAKIYAVSLVGLLLNLLLMWLFHGLLGIWDMLAKMMATGLVLGYNYAIRVLVIYRR